MPWYEGSTLLHHLENVYIASDRNLIDVRFPVQYVIRPMSHEHHDYRGYAGQVASGALRPGDEVVVLPSGFATTVAGDRRVRRADRRSRPADVGERAARGRHRHQPRRHDLRPNNLPTVTQDVDAMVCWFSDQPLRPGDVPASSTRPAPRRRGCSSCTTASTSTRCTATRRAVRWRSTRSGGSSIRTAVPLFVDEYRTQPDHRQLHPHRRGHVRDRRRGDDPRPSAP